MLLSAIPKYSLLIISLVAKCSTYHNFIFRYMYIVIFCKVIVYKFVYFFFYIIKCSL